MARDFPQRSITCWRASGRPDHIEALCRAAEPEEERLRQLEEQDRVWEELMNLLDTLAAAIGPRRLPLRVLASLFDSGAAAIRIREIPQTLDQVIVGTADRIRPTGIRSAYVIGRVRRGGSRQPAAVWDSLGKTSVPSSFRRGCSSPRPPGYRPCGKNFTPTSR